MSIRLSRILFLILLAAAAAVRFTDFTDQPLDFNPSRQLYSAIAARAIYYASDPGADPGRTALAVSHRDMLERLEPPILETIAAAGYRLVGGEALWIPRLLSILAWLIGGLLVYRLGIGLGGPAGALAGAAYFLFLPLGIYGSRSFQVDPAMVVMTGAALAAVFRWQDKRTWRWALIAGAAAGLAVLLKGVGAILLGPAMAAAVWAEARAEGKKRISETVRGITRDPQVWAMLALTLMPALLYYPGLAGETGSLYTRSIFYRLDEVLTPSFFIRWLILIDRLLEFPVVLVAVGSAFLAPRRRRAALLGLWVGYGLYGLAFPKLITTHDYYQLPLVLVAALSIAPAAQAVAEKMFSGGAAPRAVFVGLLGLAALYPGWVARSVLLAEDYREAASYWELVGEAIPTDGKAVGYTQDYGFRLAYYGWRAITVLPDGIPAEEFVEKYAEADYFVVTAKNPMSESLAEFLASTYPIAAEGGGYVIYDLQP